MPLSNDQALINCTTIQVPKLDDIQALRASVAWDIVRIAEAAPDAEQCL